MEVVQLGDDPHTDLRQQLAIWSDALGLRNIHEDIFARQSVGQYQAAATLGAGSRGTTSDSDYCCGRGCRRADSRCIRFRHGLIRLQGFIDQDLAQDLIQVLLIWVMALAAAAKGTARHLRQAEGHDFQLLGQVGHDATQRLVLQHQIWRGAGGGNVCPQRGVLAFELLPAADFHRQGVGQLRDAFGRRHEHVSYPFGDHVNTVKSARLIMY